MEKLPESSIASTLNGVWFIWKDGNNIIRVWGSALSGKEKIYLNDTLVSENRNMTTNSAYQFKDSEENNYEVKTNVPSKFKGVVECEFKRNGELKNKQICKFISSRKFKIKHLGIFILGFVLIFLLHYSLNISETIVFVLMFILIGFIFMNAGKKQYLIEEIHP